MSANLLSKIGIFVAGAVVGSLATYVYFTHKSEEIEEDGFEEIVIGREKKEEKDEPSEEVETVEKAEEIVKKEGYVAYNENTNVKSKEEKKMEERIYVISPECYDTVDYKTESLTYYADGVLVSEYGEVIDDPSEYVVADFADHFGEYEDDSVFVRNEYLETDFEILKDEDRYDEAYGDDE